MSQSTPPPAPPRRRQRPSPLREYGNEIVTVAVIVVFLVAVLVPTGLLGGFRQVNQLPRIRANQSVSYTEIRLTPRSATLQRYSPAGQASSKKGYKYLVVEIRVENRLDQRMYDVDQLIVLGAPFFDKFKPANGGVFGKNQENDTTLDPGLPRTIRFFWQVPLDARVPSVLTVTLRKRSFERNFFGERYLWKNPKPWVEARLRVRIG